MYVDQIRAYVPQDQQEAADQRMILEYIRLFPTTILTRENQIAQITSSGFVVNRGGATCADIRELIRQVQETVWEKTGVRLEPEVKFID